MHFWRFVKKLYRSRVCPPKVMIQKGFQGCSKMGMKKIIGELSSAFGNQQLLAEMYRN